jgi:SAM-dependent methyltransferase
MEAASFMLGDLKQPLRQWAHRALRPYWGMFTSTKPLSRVFGYDRGSPVDRYYIHDFLDRQRAEIHGRVLEIGDDEYSRQYGGSAITHQDVLHVHAGNPAATIVGDLAQPGVLPVDAFDCLVLTQTLHLIFDMAAAVRAMHTALRPGGVALITVPGISQIDTGEWGGTWYWSLTPASAQRLFADVFGSDGIEVTCYGNVQSATAFLRGAAAEEVGRRRLEVHDPAYPVIVAVRATKAVSPPVAR